ncbi:MAG: hypothetical protein ABIQ95_06660 [Bdellovibrionia bacterium]
MNQDEAWSYTTSFQTEREIRQVLETFGPSGFQAEVVMSAHKLSLEHSNLKGLVETYNQLKAEKQGNLTFEEASAFRLAAFLKVYPSLEDRLPKPPSTLSSSTPLKEKSTLTRAENLGKLIGSQVAPGFDSTAGNGNYLSENPVHALEHLGPTGTGLACIAPKGKVFLNFDDPCVNEALTEAEILIPNLANRQRDAFIYRPQGKNLYISPGIFEKAAKGFIIGFRPSKLKNGGPPYYLDKKALHFGKASDQCKRITIKDFEDCGQLAVLFQHAFFPEFILDDPGFRSNFFETVGHCVSDCSPALESTIFEGIVRHLSSSEKFMYSLSKDKRRINSLLLTCNCNLKIKRKFRSAYLKKNFNTSCESQSMECLNSNLKRSSSINDLVKGVRKIIRSVSTPSLNQ